MIRVDEFLARFASDVVQDYLLRGDPITHDEAVADFDAWADCIKNATDPECLQAGDFAILGDTAFFQDAAIPVVDLIAECDMLYRSLYTIYRHGMLVATYGLKGREV